MLVLGIESTCDESAAAVMSEEGGLLSSVVRSQIGSHAAFGGVVPELASRMHLSYLPACVREALAASGKSLDDIGLVAVSSRPGLVGCLLVGSTLAKGLSMLLSLPLVTVDHLLGHLLSNDMAGDMAFPCVAGVFSGGNCNIYAGRSRLDWELLARTRDDAPGEAFDKVAKILGLPYPGGPAVDAFAAGHDGGGFALPSPLCPSLGGDFSFSGIKTAVLYHVRGMQGRVQLPKEQWPGLAASFQSAVADALSRRLVDAARETGCRHIYISGGVAANRKLRDTLQMKACEAGMLAAFPGIPLCMDNAAMIARAGLLLHASGVCSGLDEDVSSRSELGFVEKRPVTKDCTDRSKI